MVETTVEDIKAFCYKYKIYFLISLLIGMSIMPYFYKSSFVGIAIGLVGIYYAMSHYCEQGKN